MLTKKVVPGTIKGSCGKCGQEVWVAPSSIKAMASTPGMELWCVPCGLALMAKREDKTVGLLPGQVEEVLRARGRGG